MFKSFKPKKSLVILMLSLVVFFNIFIRIISDSKPNGQTRSLRPPENYMPTILIVMQQRSFKFSLDTGCQVNIMDEETWNGIEYKPELHEQIDQLYGYNSENPIEVLGYFNTTVRFKNNKDHDVTLIVTKGSGGNLLSYETAVLLGVIKKIETE